MIEAERHTLEFTSGQLIIAICGLLFLWLVGFLMGVMAGRIEFGSSVAELDSPVQTAEANAPAPKTPAPDTAKAAAPPEKKDDRVQSAKAPTPKPSTPAPSAKKPAPEPPKTPATAKPATSTARAPEPAKAANAPKVVTDRPSRAATQTQAEASAVEPKPAKAPAAPPKDEKPVEVAKADAEAPKADKPVEALARQELAPKPKDDNAAPAKAPSGNYFTVQVFSAKKSNKAYADEYVANLKENAGMEGHILETEKTYQVAIGRFEDRAAAEKLRDELKKKAGFADCMVREVKP